MPRYHFAVKDAARYDDPDGTEVPDDAAARDYAIRIIREVQHGEEHNWTGWTMEVRQGQRIVWQIPFETVEPNNDGWGATCAADFASQRMLSRGSHYLVIFPDGKWMPHKFKIGETVVSELVKE
jgi:hypothetical protein